MEIRILDSGITVVDSNINGVAGIGIILSGWDLQALEYIGGWNSVHWNITIEHYLILNVLSYMKK